MHPVKDAVEELIEESYLLTLSEEEICWDLDRFSHLCEKIVTQSIHDTGRRKQLLQRLVSLKTASPFSALGSSSLFSLLFRKRKHNRTSKQEFVKRVARVKRTMIKTIERFEPQLIPLIERDLAHRSIPALPLVRRTELRPTMGRGKVWRSILVALFALVAVSLFLFVAGKG